MTAPLPSAADLVRAFGVAKKAFGQCFLTDPSILGRLVTQAALPAGAHVLEIGSGPGTLTRTLLEAGHEVTAIELDRHAVAFVTARLPHPRLRTIQGDAIKVDLSSLARPLYVVANLPYNAATEIFFRLDRLADDRGIERMVLMFQREVAMRFVALAGGKTYGPLALLSGIRWNVSAVVKLPPGAFFPRPKVHSVALRFERLAENRVSAALEPTYRKLVRTSFQQRRKTLRNSLKGLVSEAQFARAEVDLKLRCERLSLADFLRLAEQVVS